MLPLRFQRQVVVELEHARRYLKKFQRKLPPGPMGIPVLGHLPFIDSASPHLTLRKWSKDYGPIYRIQLGKVPVVVLSDPQLITMAFNNDNVTGKPPLYVTTGIMECCGIISVDGELWRSQRNMIIRSLDSFASRQHLVEDVGVNKLDVLLMEQVTRLLTQFDATNGHVFDVHGPVRFSVSNMMAKILFGRSYEDNDHVFNRQLDLCDKGASLVQLTNFINYFPFLRYLPDFGRPYSLLRELKTEHHEYLNDILSDRVRRSNGDSLIDLYIAEIRKDGADVHDKETGKQMSHVLADLFGGSTDTIKQTVKWALLHFMTRNDVQDKIHDELDKIVGSKRRPDFHDMGKLVYTRACIMEAQRLASVAPIGMPHWTLADMTLGGHYVAKDTMVIALQYAVHMNPNYWETPNLFIPERFLNEDKTELLKQSHFMPYSIGKRQCPGMDLADRCLYIILANILHRYNLLPPRENIEPSYRPLPGFTLSPRHYMLRAVLR
ncbi:hypothetical protein CHUAL_013137 [Chamberlinius hualienensis]